MNLLLWVLAYVVVTPIWALESFVTKWSWTWFLVPLGLPDIDYLQALGIAFFVSTVTLKGEKRKMTNTESMYYIGTYLTKLTFALLSSFLLHIIQLRYAGVL